MVHRLFIYFCIIANIAFGCYAQNQEPLFACYAYTDPHVQTWRLKDSPFTYQNYQDCYRGGFFRLVKNEFIDFQVDIRQRWMVEMQIFFYNGTSKTPPVCMITVEDFEVLPDIPDKCLSHNITWSTMRSTSGYSFTVSYTNANFFTTIQHDYVSRTYAPHFNIYVWQPQSLVTRSTGVCKLGDRDCSTTARTGESMLEDENSLPQQRTITSSQAKTICEANVNAYLTKTRRLPHQRSLNTNHTIANVLSSCEADLMLTGLYQAAKSSVSVLVIDELTDGLKSIGSIQSAVQSGVTEAFLNLDEAAKEVEVEVLEVLGLPTPTTTETTTTATIATTTTATIATTTTTKQVSTSQAITTTAPPRAGFKCSIYQDMYIQTWHPTNEALPPSRSCSSTSANFDLVRNKYVRYTLESAGSAIDELTIVLFDGVSPTAVCTLTVIGVDPEWMDCEKNGITPSVIKTATHIELTVYYAKANFTTIVKRDIGINIGRFNIDIYQNPELALQSTGVCNLLSSCVGGNSAQSKKLRRRDIHN